MKTIDVVLQIEQRLSQHKPRAIEKDLPEAAILVPLVKREGGLDIIMTQRAHHMRTHRGQVAFPGGRREAEDASLLETALRECHEEVGIEPGQVQIVGELSHLVSLHGLKVVPYVGWVPEEAPLRPDPSELESIFALPHDYLLQTEPQKWHELDYENKRWRVPSYHYDDGESSYEIWGLSAIVLVELMNVVFDAGISIRPV